MTQRVVAALAIAPLLALQPALAAPLPAAGALLTGAVSRPLLEVRGKREPSAGQLSARDRQKKCGAEWKEAKAANKVPPGQKWPQFWSACNKRLKGGTA